MSQTDMHLESRKLEGPAHLIAGALLSLFSIGFGGTARGAEGLVPFDGEKSSWHGFDRYDFLMEEADLSINWYAFLTEQHGLSKKPAFIGMSCGGRNAYTRATAHPDKVS